MLAGALLLAAVWVFLLRTSPTVRSSSTPTPPFIGPFPVRSNLLHVFAPRAAAVLAFLLVFGLVGGWLLAGRMLAPLTRITDATRTAATGSLAHRIRLPGRNDEFRELADAFDAMLARLEAHDRRTAEIRSQRLPRTAHPAGDHADTSRRRPQRSKPRQRRTRRPPPRRQHPSDRPHRSAAPAQPRRPAVLHPENTSTCPSSPKKPPKRSSPSQKNAASRSRPPAT